MPRSCSPVLTSLLFLFALTAEAAEKIDYARARLDRRIPATRAAGPVKIDGVLDEPVWRDAPVAKDFIQNEPSEGEPATEDTEVRVVYDDDNLYIGVFATDRSPNEILVNELKKDFRTESTDAFEVVLDTFRDERNGFMFATNPMGAKWDAQMVNEGREINSNWDGVWDVRTRIGEGGWYAEMVIPFRTLKFGTDGTQTWGINFLRRIRRRNEDTYWSPLPRIYRITRVSLAGTLENLTGLRPGHNLRLKPYGAMNMATVRDAATTGDPDGGLDAKLGLTTGLTLDLTVNPDFAQVEADEQQINLTRFSLFFPEKRDFFLENSGVFQFGPGDRPMGAAAGGGGGGGAGGQQRGRQNTTNNDLILFFSRRVGLSDEGQPIPIVGGARTTGRAGGYTIGALNLQQAGKGASPSTNFTALRLRRDILANSDVGVMFLNKDEAGAHYNRAAGADANVRVFNYLQFGGFVAKTFSPVNEAGASGQDVATNTIVSWRDNFWDLRASYLTIGERFNAEMGFVPRTGVDKTELFAGYHWRPRAVKGWLRDVFPHWQFLDFQRRTGGLDSRYVDWHLPITLQDGTFIEGGVNPNTEDIAAAFTVNRRLGIRIEPGRYDFNEYFLLWRTNSSAALSVNGRYSIGDFYDGYRRTYQLGLTTRMNERLTLSATGSVNDIDLPQGAFTTTLVSGRLDFSFSTRMFVNALLQYNTDARQWSSNVRFNLIHHPLSDFFLVYNERRDTTTGDRIDRSIIAKMTWMVAF